MSVNNLLASFDAWRRQGQPLVLATVFETAGSTYSKAGARMLINAAGDFQGMLSGGCLEGDLAERARTVIETGVAQMVTYDLGLNQQELWGLGVGCDGVMKIFLQPLSAKNEYAPFSAIADACEGDNYEVAATVLESDSEAIEPGATLVTCGDSCNTYGLSEEAAGILLDEARAALAARSASTSTVSIAGTKLKLLLGLIRPAIRLLVLGAGLDAQPVTRLAAELGWRTTVADHRPAYIDNGEFAAERVICCPAEEVARAIDLSRFDAAIVMSHHLASDRSYLSQLSQTDIGYIGLLGPANRRKRLLEELGEDAPRLKHRLHGPAGLDIGAVGPAAIALSILAEAYSAVVET